MTAIRVLLLVGVVCVLSAPVEEPTTNTLQSSLRAQLLRSQSINNPHTHARNNRVAVPYPAAPQLQDLPVVSVSPTQLTGTSANVTVSWDKVQFRLKTDWIGMFCPGSTLNLTLFTAPVQFRFASGSDKPDTMPNITGQLWFTVPNFRENCRFAYISGNAQFPAVIGVTDVVEFDNYNRPTGVHLSLGPNGDPTSMGVMWTQNNPVDAKVRYCGNSFLHHEIHEEDKSTQPLTCFNATAFAVTYDREMFCDQDTQPAAREGFFPPGILLNATMTNLVPGRSYTYQVGDDQSGWSDHFSFTAPPTIGKRSHVRIVAFGDMGNAPADGSRQHSWDFDNHGEMPAPNTTKLVNKLLESSDVPAIALHIGDISYAVGFGAEWDQFFAQIQPPASQYPWQTAIGNHEYGYSESFFSSQDSGGECGIPYLAHFPFSCLDSSVPLSQQQPWYSFEFGNVHVTAMSTEHDFTPSSPQYAWLKSDLMSVNRTRTPWLLFSGHRPMYVASEWDGDWEVAVQIQNALEELLVTAQVDLAIWGHFHAYERTCPVQKSTCDDANGVVHIVMGMAGYELTTLIPPTQSQPKWLLHAQQDNYGAVTLDFTSTTTLTTTFVSNDGSTQDTATIARKSSRV